MCSMIRTAVALILLALSFAQAAKAEPTLEEAIQFIERNVHSIDGTGGETWYSTSKASCNQITFTSVTRGKYSHTVTETFNPRDVTFAGSESKVVEFECISGSCIRHHRTYRSSRGEREMEEMKSSSVEATAVASTRVAAAFKHLQKLCGGANKSAF